MIDVKAGIQKRLRIVVPGFSAEQMRLVGEAARAAEAERWSKGLNLRDSPAKPLQEKYRRRKSVSGRSGRSSLRDLNFSGAMSAARQVTTAVQNRVVLSFTSGPAQLKANVNQKREPQIGLSPMDVAATMRVIESIHAENVRYIKRTA